MISGMYDDDDDDMHTQPNIHITNSHPQLAFRVLCFSPRNGKIHKWPRFEESRTFFLLSSLFVFCIHLCCGISYLFSCSFLHASVPLSLSLSLCIFLSLYGFLDLTQLIYLYLSICTDADAAVVVVIFGQENQGTIHIWSCNTTLYIHL